MLLLERDTHLRQLHELATRAVSGQGCISLLSGEAGIGKTSLADEFARGLRDHGTMVLRGACDDLFTPRPLGPLLDIAAEQPGSPLAHAARGDRETLFAALIDELRRRPTVLIIEDVHWADEATLDVLCYAGRRMASTRALLLLTFRDDELGPEHVLRRTLADFPRAITHRLPLTRLSEQAVQQMARRAGRSAVGLFAATNGNPFFVTEVLAADTAEVPASVRDAVLARARRIDHAARQVLDLVSVVPGRTEIWLIEALLGDVTEEIESACNTGMLQPQAGSVSFRHELARRTWENSLNANVRNTLHRRVLGALLQRADPDDARIVHHADHAGDGATVLKHGRIAAQTAARAGAHLQAAALYDATVPYLGALEPAEKAQVLELYARELQIIGRVDDGLRALHEALTIWKALNEPLQQGKILSQMAQLTWFRGDLADAVKLHESAISVLEPLGPTPELAMAYSARSQLHMCIEDHDPAIRVGEEAIRLGRELGRDDVVMHSLNNVGTARLYRGEEIGLQLLEESLRMALGANRHLDAGRALINLTETLTCLRQFDRAKRYEQQAIEFCVEHNIDSYFVCVVGDRAQVRMALGDWNGSVEDAETVLSHPRCPPVDRVPALAAIARLRARRGDPDVDAPLEEALAIAERSGEVLRMWPVVAARLEAAWLRERNEQQRAREVELGHRVIAMARRATNRWALGEINFWLRMLDSSVGIEENAAEPFRLAMHSDFAKAASQCAAHGLKYDRAVMLVLSAEEDAMREGLTVLRELGANMTVERLLRHLRARGVARIPRGPAAATRNNPVLLTRKQAAVLELIIEGLSNNEIADRLCISSKTAAHHVSAVLAKLGARSRTEAAAKARDLGIAQPI